MLQALVYLPGVQPSPLGLAQRIPSCVPSKHQQWCPCGSGFLRGVGNKDTQDPV